MMMFVWACVMSSLWPGGAQIAAMSAAAFQAQLRAEIETPRLTSSGIGAAQHITRYGAPSLAR
jgi:hypothetical protein